jgi:integrase
MRPPRVRPSTWVNYEILVRHADPLAAIPLYRLTPNDLRAHLRSLTDAGFAPGSVGNHLQVLRTAFRQAVSDRLIRVNPADGVVAPRKSRPEIRILTVAEGRRLLADGDPLPVVLVTTGLRLGEALGLRWADVDEARGTLTVTGSLRPVPRAFRQARQPRLERTEVKTAAGRRTLSLLPATAAVLGRLRAARGDPAPIDGLIFTEPDGGPSNPRTALARWERTRDRLGIDDRVRIHDLRHTAASFALAGGATLDDVKRMLGHANIAMTSDTYGHLVEGRSREVADRLAAVLGG